MIDLSILIVTWNSRRDLELCLPSLAAGGVRCSSEVVVIDNASEDDGLAYAQHVLPDVKIIANDANLGFARANNQGMALAGGRFVCLLNPDTVVHTGAVDGLVHFMDTHTDAWACGPGLLNGDGSPQRTGVRFPSIWNLAVESLFLDRIFPRTRLFGAHRELYEQGAEPRAVDFVQGSCLVVRKSAIDAVGGLDEGFFMYFEETDWCKRFAGAGGKVYIVPTALVTHYGGGTFGHYDDRRLIHYHASLFRYYRKHHDGAARVALRCVIAFRSVLRIAVWVAVALVRPGLRVRALSAMKGYVRVLSLTLGGGGQE